MKFNIVVSVLIAGLLFAGCGSSRSSKDKNYVRDTVFVEIDNDGPVMLQNQGSPGELTYKEPIVFNKIGQEKQLNLGDKVEFIFDGISPQDADFNYTIHPEKGIVKIKLVKRGTIPDVVSFDEVCQIIIVGRGDNFPRFEVKDTLIGKQQLIVTPVVNDDCEVIGYELRYGSIDDANCLTGRKNLRRFQNCMKYGRITSPPIKEKNWKRYFVK